VFVARENERQAVQCGYINELACSRFEAGSQVRKSRVSVRCGTFGASTSWFSASEKDRSSPSVQRFDPYLWTIREVRATLLRQLPGWIAQGAAETLFEDWVIEGHG
jgi:hypothetical protein